MQLVKRTIGNNTFVYPVHRSLCRISINTFRNQLILIHVPEISMALTECNPHITRANALVGPYSLGRQGFLQFLPSGRHKYCELRRRVAGETVRRDPASQPAKECLDKPLWEPLISHCLFLSKLPSSTRDITLSDIWMSRDAVHGAEPSWDSKLYRQTLALHGIKLPLSETRQKGHAV